MIEAKGRTGTVTFDGQTVTIVRKGLLARTTVGKGTKSIPIKSITAVQWKEPGAMVNGYIQFTVAGGIERRSKFGRQTIDAGRDENSVIVTKGQAPAFRELRDAVQAAISSPAPLVPTVAPNLVGELRELAELRDSGVLSEDQFEAAKARLLSDGGAT